MDATAGASDVGFGLTLAFVVVAIGAAVVMAVTVETQVVAAWAFAAATVAGTLAVAAPHLFADR